MNRYFNENEFQHAIDLLESNPFKAKELFEIYIQKYPNDYYARVYYAIVLTRICMFDEAEKEYEFIKDAIQNDSFYTTRYKNKDGLNYNLLVLRLKILAWHEDYAIIFHIINKYSSLFEPNDINYISYFCRKKLGLLPKNIKSNSYRFMQTYKYSEDLFLEHNKIHLKEYSENQEKPSEYIFESDFPYEKALEEIKKYIPSDKRTFPGYFDDTYFFRYDNCGKAHNVNTNYFAVVVYHNTTNIITMCPTSGFDRLPHVDLNYLKYEIEEPKVKRMSQIDKFNKRFNLK